MERWPTYFLSYRKNSAAFTTIRYPSSPTGTPLSIIFSHWVRFRYHLPNQMPWAKTWKNGDSSSSALPFAMPICKLRGLSTTIWRIAFAGKGKIRHPLFIKPDRNPKIFRIHQALGPPNIGHEKVAVTGKLQYVSALTAESLITSLTPTRVGMLCPRSPDGRSREQTRRIGCPTGTRQ